MSAKKIAFYAPMKPPSHPSPSGDRQMARLLLAALGKAGHQATLASELKTYLSDPEDEERHDQLITEAAAERDRIAASWDANGPPDLWVSYHPYYKSPDILGPALCQPRSIPWVTIEASWSARRSVGLWGDFQSRAMTAVEGAAVNIALTERDAGGLTEFNAGLTIARMPPFIEAKPFLAIEPSPEHNHLVVVAMMRSGDKLDSYGMLARALEHLDDLDWHLTIVGDGPARAAVEALFAGPSHSRITWTGRLDPDGVRAVLARGTLLTWPGHGEAYGLSYLEAQAVGLPVVAQNTAGVPEVVTDGISGLLTPVGDAEAYADAIRSLLSDLQLRTRLAEGARRSVLEKHTLDRATLSLQAILQRHVWENQP